MTEREAAVQKLMDSESDLKVSICKQTILDRLCKALWVTEDAWDVQRIIYCRFGDDMEAVTIEWRSGRKRYINVSGAPDTALIRDVVENILDARR